MFNNYYYLYISIVLIEIVYIKYKHDKHCIHQYRGMVDENGEQFVAYFLPTKETMEKTKPKSEEDDGDDIADDQQFVYCSLTVDSLS